MSGTIKYLSSGDCEYFLDGKPCSKEAFDAAFPPREVGEIHGHLPSCWPMKSQALSVHPRQARQAQEDSRAKGVPTEFTRHGTPIFTDRGHRKAYLKAYGYFDNDAGYGDAAPGDFSGDRPDPPDLSKEYDLEG